MHLLPFSCISTYRVSGSGIVGHLPARGFPHVADGGGSAPAPMTSVSAGLTHNNILQAFAHEEEPKGPSVNTLAGLDFWHLCNG